MLTKFGNMPRNTNYPKSKALLIEHKQGRQEGVLLWMYGVGLNKVTMEKKLSEKGTIPILDENNIVVNRKEYQALKSQLKAKEVKIVSFEGDIAFLRKRRGTLKIRADEAEEALKLYREFFSLTKDKINTNLDDQDVFLRIMELLELLN